MPHPPHLCFKKAQCYTCLLTLETQQAISEELSGGDGAQPCRECLMLQMKTRVMQQGMQKGGS